MSCPVVRIESVEPFGDMLSFVALSNGRCVVANRRTDGAFRWAVGSYAAYLPVGAVAPQQLLEDRGYWAVGAKKGFLGGSKGNRVTPRKFGPEENRYESHGIIFKIDPTYPGVPAPAGVVGFISKRVVHDEHEALPVKLGDDVSEFLGITLPEAA